MDNQHTDTDPSDQPAINVHVDGDVQGQVQVAGRDIVQNKTIIQRLPWRIMAAALAVIVMGFIVVVVLNNQSAAQVGSNVSTIGTQVGSNASAAGTQVGDLNSGVATLIAPTALPFPAATGDEVLVIVADFTGESVDARIYNALRDRVAAEGLTGVRVERLKGVAPETAEEAVAVGQTFNATLVIWGIADSAGIEPHYEIVNNRANIQLSVDLGVTTALDLPSFSAYIVTGVPDEFEYLMLFSLGQISLFNKNYAQAIRLFDQALSIDLGQRQAQLKAATVYFYRGYTHGLNGDSDAALADYSKAIELDSGYTFAYNNRGVVYTEQGNLKAALADFSKAIELDPKYALAYYNRGIVYIDQGNLEAALADYSKAIELNPEDEDAYYNRGLVYKDQGNLEAALADFSKAIELNPQDAEAYSNRGIVYANQGNLEAALADFSKAIELNPQDAEAYNNRGYTLAQLGTRLDQALNDLNHALELDPNNASYHDSRASVYYKLGQYPEGLSDATTAIGQGQLFSYYTRGLIYQAQGKKVEAIADFTRFIKDYPDEVPQKADARQRITDMGGTPP
jgi:tetratricopeptide (TPR) repeat protein